MNFALHLTSPHKQVYRYLCDNSINCTLLCQYICAWCILSSHRSAFWLPLPPHFLGTLNDLTSMEKPLYSLKFTEHSEIRKNVGKSAHLLGRTFTCKNIETLKHWSIQALKIPFYCTDGIKIIFMLTRNNSKQLSCILLIIHTGAINFQIHNEFHEQKVATSMKYISQHIPQPLTEVWLRTSSISHLPLLLCLFRYWCWCKVPNSRKQITWFFFLEAWSV